jgi:hypothetical protein
MRHRYLLVLLVFLLAGCGSSSDPNAISGQQGAPAPRTASAFVPASAGGQVTHPDSGHAAQLLPGSLSDDSQVTLSLLDASNLSARNDDFQPVGTALRVDFDGATTLIGEAHFTIPYSTDHPEHHSLYWHLPQGLLVPLETTYDPQAGAFTGILDLSQGQLNLPSLVPPQSTAGSVTVSVVDETGWFSRPAHVPWPGYNLYVYRHGDFQKIVDQSVPLETIPAPGSSPLMMVHGLGSSIPAFDDTADYLQNEGVFTQIYGFEYDTLNSLASNGAKLTQAYASIPANAEWSHLAHSMGCLVSRSAFESSQSAPYTHNSVAFAAGPHRGSPVINVLQGNLDLFDEFIRYLVVNEVMDFRNADGTPCQVDVSDPGFADLAEGSPALQALNNGAASHHPEETYRTFAGNSPGLEYDAADFLLGVYPDDGLVTVGSANPGALIGAVEATVVPESHSTIVSDTEDSLPEILDALLEH